jgi:tetratricopeptide (TPR) repeat protein
VIVQSHSLSEAIKVPTNPFPGLRPFEFEESHLFFGRDSQVEKLVDKLKGPRFVAVVGTSGSGKSSLVRAGLLPALLGGVMSEAGTNWRLAVMRPGNDPIRALATALNEPRVFGSDDPQNVAIQIAVAEATFRRGSRGLVEVVQQNGLPSNENVLVVVDQFEELFRFAREAARKAKEEGERYQNDAAAFVKLLLEARAQRDVNIYVVLTMRSDFLGQCATFWDLPEAVNESQYLIPRLTRDQLRETIIGPIGLAGGDISPRLLTQLLNDIGADQKQDQLPVLQHLLMRIWNESKELLLDVVDGDRRIPHRDLHKDSSVDTCCYDAVGGMSAALSRHADEAYDELPDERHRLVAEKLFKALTEKGVDNLEIRRPITVQEICEIANATQAEVVTVIEAFRQPGRSFLMPPYTVPLTNETLIDISHESLIRRWTRLDEWTKEEATSARNYRWLAETAVLNSEGDPSPLVNPMLQLMLNWRRDSEPNAAWAARYHSAFKEAMEFLDFSVVKNREREESEKQKLEWELKQAQQLAAEQKKVAELQARRDEDQRHQLAEQLRQAQQKEATQRELAEVQQKSARRGKQYLAALSFLIVITIAASGVAITSQRLALNEGDRRIGSELRAKLEAENLAAAAIAAQITAEIAQDVAEAERIKAEDARKVAAGLAENLDKELKAKQQALIDVERTRREKEEQATTNSYFKSAFDDLADHNANRAVANLEKALAYFTKKNDVPNIISTHINIGDIQSSTEDDIDADDLDHYAEALNLIRRSNAGDPILAKVLTKAAKALAVPPTDAEDRSQATTYYDEAAQVFGRMGRPQEQSDTFIQEGKMFAVLSDDDARAEAEKAFDKAIDVFPAKSDQARITLNIAEYYVELLGEQSDEKSAPATASEKGDVPSVADASDTTPQDSSANAKAADQRRQKAQRDVRIRKSANEYFLRAAKLFEGTDEEASARALSRAATVLGDGESIEVKETAAKEFVRAAKKYAELQKVQEQKEALIAAGDIFRNARDTSLHERAYKYYEDAVNNFRDDKDRGDVLSDIGYTLGASSDVGQKRKAIEYYDRAALAFNHAGDKSQEVKAYLDAASILENIAGESEQRAADGYYDRALTVYEGNASEQVTTLIGIGRTLARLTNETRRSKSDEFFARALSLARSSGGPKAEAQAYLDLGIVYYGTLRKWGLAMTNFQAARARFEEANDRIGQGIVLYRMAVVAPRVKISKAEADKFAGEARTLLLPALRDPQAANEDKKKLADGFYALGYTLRRIKDYRNALDSYERAITLYEQAGQKARARSVRNVISLVKRDMRRGN